MKSYSSGSTSRSSSTSGSTSSSDRSIPGVSCDVHGCKYNEASNCSASAISVQNESAQRKAETFCSTFYPRSY